MGKIRLNNRRATAIKKKILITKSFLLEIVQLFSLLGLYVIYSMIINNFLLYRFVGVLAESDEERFSLWLFKGSELDGIFRRCWLVAGGLCGVFL